MATALVAVGTRAGGLRDISELRDPHLSAHRRPQHPDRGAADNHRMGSDRNRRRHPSAVRLRRLAGAPPTAQPGARRDGNDRSGCHHGCRLPQFRPDIAAAIGHHRRRRADPDRPWHRVGARMGGQHDALAPCDRRRAGGPGPARGPTDGAGLLQYLRLAHGGDDQRRAACAGQWCS